MGEVGGWSGPVGGWDGGRYMLMVMVGAGVGFLNVGRVVGAVG